MRDGTQQQPVQETTKRGGGRRFAGGVAAATLALTSLVAIGPAGPVSAALDPAGEGNVCEGPPQAEPFDDVGETDPARDEIECLYNADITTGVTATTYEPNSPVTRRHMVLFLHRFAGVADANEIDDGIEALPAGDGDVPFTDIVAEDIAFTELDALADAGVVEGFDDGTFRPNDEVTRRQMAKFLVRIQEALAGADILPVDPPDAFGDDEGDSGEAELDILAAEEVFEGDADGNVNPGDDISRRQMALVLTRKLQYLYEQGLIDQLFVDGAVDGGGGGDGGDEPSLVIEGGPTETTEANGQDTFTVALSKEPTDDVTVAIESDDPGEAVAAPVSFLFTAANWNVPQEVLVTGMADDVADGDVDHLIQLTVEAGSAAEFVGVTGEVNNTNVDLDPAPVLEGVVFSGNVALALFSEAVNCGTVDLSDFSVDVDGPRSVDGIGCDNVDSTVEVTFGGTPSTTGTLNLIGTIAVPAGAEVEYPATVSDVTP